MRRTLDAFYAAQLSGGPPRVIFQIGQAGDDIDPV
jgi:hypothetical protein